MRGEGGGDAGRGEQKGGVANGRKERGGRRAHSLFRGENPNDEYGSNAERERGGEGKGHHIHHPKKGK